jgi:glycosyltransferase involved in cell wall biosynthesis
MALGVPCIATDVGDTRVVLGDVSAVVRPDDAAALAEAVDALVSLPAEARREIGRRGRARIEANFTAKALIDRTTAALADR